MEKRFKRLLEKIRARGNFKSEFSRLSSLYLEPQRFYHNLKHIQGCLREFDSVKKMAIDPNCLEFSIWYHDIIYDTQSTTNEEESAEMAYDVCKKICISDDFANKSKKLILATKHEKESYDLDSKILVSIDFAILGKPSTEFKEYEANIRKEYYWLLEDEFREGHYFVLKNFLDRLEKQSLYLTDFFREKYEVQARKNIISSLEFLRKDFGKNIRDTSKVYNEEDVELPVSGLAYMRDREFDNSFWINGDKQENDSLPASGLRPKKLF